MIFGEKSVGKSTVLDVLNNVAFNASSRLDGTVAAFTNAIYSLAGTILFDQMDRLSYPGDKNADNARVRNVLAGGYSGGKSSTLEKMIKDTHATREWVSTQFSSFGPKGYASTRQLWDDIRDRLIVITMTQATGTFPGVEYHFPEWARYRSQLYRLALLQWPRVRQLYEERMAEEVDGHYQGELVTARSRQRWRAIEVMLRAVGVDDEEQAEIFQSFLGGSQDSNDYWDGWKLEIADTIKYWLKESQGNTIDITIKNITDALDGPTKKLDGWKKTRHAIEVMIGITLKSWGLQRKRVGHDNKTVYVVDRKAFNTLYQQRTEGGEPVVSEPVSAQRELGF